MENGTRVPDDHESDHLLTRLPGWGELRLDNAPELMQ